MNIDIRKNIINNFKDSDEIEIKKSIDDSLKENDEITLPGLGVFFELMWKKCNMEDKAYIVKLIKESI